MAGKQFRKSKTVDQVFDRYVRYRDRYGHWLVQARYFDAANCYIGFDVEPGVFVKMNIRKVSLIMFDVANTENRSTAVANCGNDLCVRPQHCSWTRHHNGTTNGMSASTIEAIKRLISEGATDQEIAHAHGLGRKTVNHIRNRHVLIKRYGA